MPRAPTQRSPRWLLLLLFSMCQFGCRGCESPVVPQPTSEVTQADPIDPLDADSPTESNEDPLSSPQSGTSEATSTASEGSGNSDESTTTSGNEQPRADTTIDKPTPKTGDRGSGTNSSKPMGVGVRTAADASRVARELIQTAQDASSKGNKAAAFQSLADALAMARRFPDDKSCSEIVSESESLLSDLIPKLKPNAAASTDDGKTLIEK